MSELLPFLTQRLPDSLKFLEQMVNMESPSLDKALVDNFARFVGPKFEAIGGRIDYVQADRFGDHLRGRQCRLNEAAGASVTPNSARWKSASPSPVARR